MARIPVEEKSGSSWWKWLIPLLLIGGLAVWALDEATEPPYDDYDDVDDVAVVDDYEDEAVATYGDLVYESPDADAMARDAEPIAFATLMNSSTSMQGELVALSDIQAQSLVGDSTFFVYPEGEMDRMLVVLAGMGESELGARGTDGRFNVDPGESFRIVGRIQTLSESDHTDFGLTEAQWDELDQDDWYLRAVRVERLNS